MLAPDDLSSLATDFRALSGSQRRAILGALNSFERVQFAALLDRPLLQEEDPDQPDCLGQFSPWLRDQIQFVEREGEGGERSTITARTRATVDELVHSAHHQQSTNDAGPPTRRSRSLINALFSRQNRP